MDQVGVGLATISGLRVHDYPPKSAQPPFAFVDLPETINFDESMGRGTDRCTLRVVVCVANVVDRSMRDSIAAYAAGSGVLSVRAALDAATIGQSAAVTSVAFQSVELAGGSYAGAVFELDVAF